MSFSSFSKDFRDNSFTSVENRFITKYLPEASGDAVRAYLYGLYLCNTASDLDAATTAKLLGMTPEALLEIFTFWEECGLVQVLSRDPLYVEYLPVSAAVGKPKPLRPEKYAQFNRELFRLLQMAGKDLRPYEQRRVLEFLENSPMEQNAFLLIVEYYEKKEGEKFNINHVLNKAKQLEREGKFTFEQVESEFSDFHKRSEELAHIFALLAIYRKPQDSDYALLDAMHAAGLETGAIYACAETLKKATMPTLDRLTAELIGRKLFTEREAREYLKRREALVETVYSVAKKLGVKVQDPRPYLEEYAEKWSSLGFAEELLLPLAALGLKLGYGFSELDGAVLSLHGRGISDEKAVKEYCAEKERELRILQDIRPYVGVVKRTENTLDTVGLWLGLGISESLIIEAARRAQNASSPLSYMNKLLMEWKEGGVRMPAEIPDPAAAGKAKEPYRSEAAVAADERSARDIYYTRLRDRAMRRVERAEAIAARDEEFSAAERELRSLGLELAKAELSETSDLTPLKERVELAKKRRAEALARLRLSERDFTPAFTCKKCSDTGFLPDGKLCDCYKPS